MFSTFSPRRLPLIGRFFRGDAAVANTTPEPVSRKYPTIAPSTQAPTRPISFVVVRFSDEYLHNIAKSECVNSPLNELIEVDNSYNLYFDNLSLAVEHGVLQAKHELIAVVHENVFLPEGWQSRFEASLEELEKHDDSWGILGSSGWDLPGTRMGHWSDPEHLRNTFETGMPAYRAVARLDEQILVFHKARLPTLDPCLPSVYCLEVDLSAQVKGRGQSCYIIDAPTIQSYANKHGELVVSQQQTEATDDRNSRSYEAIKACCEDYINYKYEPVPNGGGEPNHSSSLGSDRKRQLDQPIILLSRGGSGSRILSRMAQDAGVFVGEHLNNSGDSLDLVIPIYKMVIEKYRCHATWQKTHTLTSLRSIAANKIRSLSSDQLWGFKLPESVLVIPELESVFPNARYVYFQRDPLSICLRRTHLTARLDNHIGRITLPLAYDHANIPRERILADHPAEHMAYTTVHQMNLINTHMNSLAAHRKLTIRFEDTIENPSREVNRLTDWLESTATGYSTEEFVDINRASNPSAAYPPELEAKVSKILEKIRKESGYL